MLADYITQAPVSSLIFLLTIGASIYTFSNPQWYQKLMLHPYSIYRDKQYLYEVLTSGFIHKDWTHLLFNMITFYYFGFGLEMIMVSLSGVAGHFLFALLYFLGLVLSDIPTLIQQKNNPNYYSLGASGAISAVLFSYILFQPMTTLGIMFIIPMPAYLFAVLYLGYCIWAARNAKDGINHDAHLYGALTGVAFTLIAYPWSFRHFIDQF